MILVDEERDNCCSSTEEDCSACDENLLQKDADEQDTLPDNPVEMLAEAKKEIASLEEQLHIKEGQVQELQQRFQRLQSDFDNFRKRTNREKEEFVQTAAASLIESILPVMDNFERAAQASTGGEAAFREGIEMIFKQLEKILFDAGLEKVDAIGNPFDPSLHQAVAMVEDDSCEDNTVVGEFQKGYLFAGRVLRPAMVKVSRKSTV